MEIITIKLDNKKKEINEFKIEGEINPIEVAQILMQMAIKTLSNMKIAEAEKKIIKPTQKEKAALTRH